MEREHRLDLRVIMWVVAREQTDRAAIGESKSRGGIRHAPPKHRTRPEREQADTGTSAERRAVVAVISEKARPTGYVVARIDTHHRQQLRELRRIMLPVAVDLRHVAGVVLPCIEDTGLHRAANPEVVREPEDNRAGLLGASRRGFVDPSSTTTTS